MKLFREQSYTKLTSPDQLNEMMRVPSLRVWVILSAIIVLFVGILLWICLKELERTLDVMGTQQGDQVVLHVDLKQGTAITLENDVICGNEHGEILEIISQDTAYEIKVGNFPPATQTVHCQITLESIHPLSLLFSEGAI